MHWKTQRAEESPEPELVERIWDLTRFLFQFGERVGVGEESIDMAFYLAFFEPTARPHVGETPSVKGHSNEGPFPLDLSKRDPFLCMSRSGSLPSYTEWPPASRTKLRLKNHDIIFPRSPMSSDLNSSFLSGDLLSFKADHGTFSLGESAVLWSGPRPFKQLEMHLPKDGQPQLELRVFSARLSGKVLAAVYDHAVGHLLSEPHRKSGKNAIRLEWKLEKPGPPRLPYILLKIDPPWPHRNSIATIYENEVRPKKSWVEQLYCGGADGGGSQDWENLIRTWVVFALHERAGMQIRSAIREWNRRYHHLRYTMWEPFNQTQPGDVQFNKDRRKLLLRLPFLTPML